MQPSPGKKSTEFYITLLIVLIPALTGVMVNFYGGEDRLPEWARLASLMGGAALSVLAGLGYQVSRTGVKKEAIKAQGELEKAKLDYQEDPEGGFIRLALLPILACLLLLAGCVTMAPFDPMTAEQIQKTIEFEEMDFERSMETLDSLEAPDLDKNGLKLRHDGEMARLRAWLSAEEAKRLEGEQ